MGKELTSNQVVAVIVVGYTLLVFLFGVFIGWALT